MTPAAIRAELARQGLTQAGAAHLMGVDPRTMRRWVEGLRDIPVPAWRLLTVLDVPNVRDRLLHDDEMRKAIRYDEQADSDTEFLDIYGPFPHD